jgi:DeoR family fructose operon transcriptional repressor
VTSTDRPADSGGTPDGARRRPLYTVQRHRAILNTLQATGRIDAAATAEALRVSSETIRKDLSQLEHQGLLHRVHGGAVPAGGLSVEPVVSARTSFVEEKRRIARAALNELPTQGSIFIDAGSTTTIFTEMIPGDRDLTVFTNTLTIALALVSRRRLTVHTLGGRVRSRTFAEVDNWAIRALSELHVDVAFLGTNGMSLAHGLTTPDPSEAAVKRQMLSVAEHTVLLADHSKLGNLSMIRYGDLTDVDLLITDTDVADDDLIHLQEAGLRVVRA